MTALNAMQRHQRILEALELDGKVSVTTLSDSLRVSVVTIRNDLEQLERQQVLRRIRGGALAVRAARFERPLHLASQAFTEEKQRIAKLAATLVRDGETIMIDAGSTALAFARALSKSLNDVAVVTNSLDVALVLAEHPGIRVVVTGGTLRGTQRSLTAPFSTLVIGQLNADTAYISCTGIDPGKGFTTGSWEEAEVEKAMIAAASRCVILADHSKFGHVGSARVADLSAVDLLVTDSDVAPETILPFEAKGLRVLTA
ncbi:MULTISPECIES: DeoR/GlpR family DNA-binding transcription regulator [unclassified Rhizobium]|uniref:DeoR/GlpR family DNA-binding transcription regulator n=1 Tax=unclassified Rhizobium TaxID=2613769 RepID=UPI001615332C|nr:MULTISPECIES: DeoR/GlpR family DNA-binding transcription regulator [unclassified Rhizobium]MBB3320380.1 DeoR family transcriptional regulator of aga operon [Rhizobium sp. BK181]MCS4096253.1 DeoR family transcriptional regulator of aga operon [Rhizobium sp. BK176]